MACERFTYSFICLQAPQVPLARWPRKYSTAEWQRVFLTYRSYMTIHMDALNITFLSFLVTVNDFHHFS